MAGLKKQFEGFTDVYDKLGAHLRHAQQSYDEARVKLDRAGIRWNSWIRERFPNGSKNHF